MPGPVLSIIEQTKNELNFMGKSREKNSVKYYLTSTENLCQFNFLFENLKLAFPQLFKSTYGAAGDTYNVRYVQADRYENIQIKMLLLLANDLILLIIKSW